MSEGPFFFFCVNASIRRFAHRRAAVSQLKRRWNRGRKHAGRTVQQRLKRRNTVVERGQLCVSQWDFLAHAQQVAFAFSPSCEAHVLFRAAFSQSADGFEGHSLYYGHSETIAVFELLTQLACGELI